MKKNIIHTEEFIREPVKLICDTIRKNDSKRIILTGERGCGKSTVLNYYNDKSIGTNKECILVNFDAVGISTITKDENLLRHFFEINFAQSLLNYINKNYNLTYNNHFHRYQEILRKISNDTYCYLNNAAFDDDICLNRAVSQKEFTKPIIEEFKDVLAFDSLELAIDRFDWINANDGTTQKILENYFDMFDKVIITSDDNDLKEESNRTNYIQKGYSFIDVNYGKDKETLKAIINKRILQHNYGLSYNNQPFPIQFMTDEIYDDLLTTCNGNISFALDITRIAIDHFNWENGNCSAKTSFMVGTDLGLEEEKKFQKIQRPKKFHL